MGTTKDGRWFRLDAGWRAEREPRRAGRAGREVFLAACELAAGQAWRLDGVGGWLPDAKFDILEVAALLGVPDDDAQEVERLAQGLAACVREGLIVRDDAHAGFLVSRDWWNRMVPDRTARDRKAAERLRKAQEAAAARVTAGAVTSRDGASGDGAEAEAASAPQAPAQARSRSVTPQNGTRREACAGVAETPAFGDVGGDVTADVVTSRHGTRRNEVESSTGCALSPSSKRDGVREHAPSDTPKPRPTLPPGVAIRGEYTPPQAPATSTPEIAERAKAAMREALGPRAGASPKPSPQQASTASTTSEAAVGVNAAEPAASSTPHAVTDDERGLRAEVAATHGQVGRWLHQAGLTPGDLDQAVRGIAALAEGSGPLRPAARELRCQSPRDRTLQWLHDARRLLRGSIATQTATAAEEELGELVRDLRALTSVEDFHTQSQARLLLLVAPRPDGWESQVRALIGAARAARVPVGGAA